MVTTSRITHATPAATYAHSAERNWESDGELPADARAAGFPDIALQMMQFPDGSKKGLDVALGGGRREFLSDGAGRRTDGRDLIAEWQAGAPNRHYVTNRAELAAVTPAQGRAILGLFSDSHMHFETDRTEAAPETEPSLAEMTTAAIRLLKTNPKGYVLVVEGARIDHAHHMNNAYRALRDTIAVADAVEAGVKASDPATTLILVTADHGHPISIRGHPTRGNPILGTVVENDDAGMAESDPALDQTGRPYTILSYAGGPGYLGASDRQEEGHKRFPHLPRRAQRISKGRPGFEGVDPEHPNHLQEATLPLSNGSHSGEDVPVYATGPGSSLVHGVIEQNVIYHVITEALGWNEPPSPVPSK